LIINCIELNDYPDNFYVLKIEISLKLKNPNIFCRMSNLYRIDKNDPKNRFLIAKQKIQVGQTIIETLPLVCFSLEVSRNIVCQWCFKVSEESKIVTQKVSASVLSVFRQPTAAKRARRRTGRCTRWSVRSTTK